MAARTLVSSMIGKGLLNGTGSKLNVLSSVGQIRCCAVDKSAEFFSSKPHETIKDVHVLTLHKKPVNSLSLDFMRGMPGKIKELEKDKTCRGVIIKSACPKVFSAGLDLEQLIGADNDFLAEFGEALQRFWESLYGTYLATVCAANGHAIAGGCLIALCCDYRLMVEEGTIGLPETHLGIVAPVYLREMTVQTIGRRQAEWAMLTGHNMKAPLAQQIGLVDEVVKTEEELNQRADEMAKLLTSLNEHGRMYTKLNMREPMMSMNAELREQSTKNFVELISSPITQKALKTYFDGLKKTKKAN